ncbi:D-2-hydroxyacid dehydrogenase [Ruania zhangjianzhongii]|uniref:D-2-hydroxyacid dehydrogenase n=1 Tax=Ruania zhangjianzhongii TaxID=2603206 RepID=UPI0011CB8B4C|nr:D-2-hydroxyacid dehydrogenase [Ruania zhangjianzhongii]
MIDTIVVKRPAAPSVQQLKQAAAGREVVEIEQVSEQSCRASGVDPLRVGAVLGASPGDDLSFLPALRWVHSSAAGVDAWMAAGAIPDQALLTSAVGNGAVPLAEHALLLMLMLNRDAPRWFRAQQRREWDRYVHGELAGASLGIVGYGNSGTDLAGKALACHMQVRALRRSVGPAQDGDVRLVYHREGLEELLRESDFVVVTTPLTALTRGLIGAEELALMMPSAFLVVVSRGGIVDDDALLAALREGTIAGAGLDAHGDEPLPADSELWDLQNVIVTPHNGATTPGTGERGRQIVLDNVARWVNGDTLVNVVDPSQGY